MENFTPVSATLGGLLIGLAAVILMHFNGRIAGISGILSGAAFASGGDKLWRVFFIIGIIAAPVLYGLFRDEAIAFSITPSITLLVVGGLLVGFGTRLGSGCTSGHGVCGLSRFSVRSLAAVCIFMVSGGITVAIAKLFLAG